MSTYTQSKFSQSKIQYARMMRRIGEKDTLSLVRIFAFFILLRIWCVYMHLALLSYLNMYICVYVGVLYIAAPERSYVGKIMFPYS